MRPYILAGLSLLHVIHSSMLQVLQEHWCQQVKFIAIEMTSILQEVDAMAVQKCAHEIEMKQEQVRTSLTRHPQRPPGLHKCVQCLCGHRMSFSTLILVLDHPPFCYACQAKETRQRRAKQWKALHELACTRADAAGLSPPAPPSPRAFDPTLVCLAHSHPFAQNKQGPTRSRRCYFY